MIESKFQGEIVKGLTGVGAEILNVHGHAMQAAGWPDLYVAHPVWSGWLELKVGERACSEKQRQRIRRLRMRGVPAWVLRHAEDSCQLENERGDLQAYVGQPTRDAARFMRALAMLGCHGG